MLQRVAVLICVAACVQRVAETHNETFIDMMEQYYGQEDDVKVQQLTEHLLDNFCR